MYVYSVFPWLQEEAGDIRRLQGSAVNSALAASPPAGLQFQPGDRFDEVSSRQIPNLAIAIYTNVDPDKDVC
jgi:hypothetical protein